MIYVLGAITGLISVTNWYSVWRDHHRVEWWTKLLTMVALIATAVAAGATDSATGWWLLEALFFGLLGDLALLGDTPERFVGGVFAFLIGHLAYLACFISLGLSSPGWAWACLVVLALIAWASRRTTPTAYRLSGWKVAVPIAIYSVVIGAMLVVAWFTGVWEIAAGATIFVVSDTIIGVTLADREFDRPNGPAHVAIMVTYHVGQFLIAYGVLSSL